MKHHPKSATLADYAAGALDEALGVVVATHLDLCPTCRTAAHDFEALGGACLEQIAPAPMSAGALQRFWRRADRRPAAATPAPTRPARQRTPASAQPLSAYLNGGLDAVRWKPIAPGMAQSIIKADGYRPGALRLLKIAPGGKIPKHGHRGAELTVVLKGGYEDELGAFAEGDLIDLDRDDVHSPRAIGGEPCVCLVAISAPLIFKSLLSKAAQPFIGL